MILTNGMSPKFWKNVHRDGLMRTYMRMFQTVRDDAHSFGHLDNVKCVGIDEFGNKYYEDFGVDRSLIRPSQQKMG